MIAVCLKWIDQRGELAVAVEGGAPDPRYAGASAADLAALEWALRLREARPGETVVVCSVGPTGADAVLRDALAAGADRAVRVDAPFGSPSQQVAAELADQVGGAALVLCGDASVDRGTGSVPALLAHHLGLGQALGLVSLSLGEHGELDVLRRLDGGRRERIAVTNGAVLSVEGSTARLRRAGLRAMLERPDIEVHPARSLSADQTATASRPYRPRARVLPAPAGPAALDRIRSLTAAGGLTQHGETVTLAPADAARRIVAALTEWGYLEPRS